MELVDWVPFSNRGVMDTFDRSFTSHKPSIFFPTSVSVSVDYAPGNGELTQCGWVFG